MTIRAHSRSLSHVVLIYGLCFILLAGSLFTMGPPVQAEGYLVQECDDPDSAWLFCDDFEQDRLSSYYDTGDPAKLYRSPSAGLDGSASLTTRFQGNYPSAGSLKLAFGKTPDNATFKPVGDPNEVHREFYWRTYVKNDADWTVGQDGRFAVFYVYGPGSQVVAKAELQYSYGKMFAYLHPALLDGNDQPIGLQSSIYVNSSGGTPLSINNAGTWQLVEVRGKLNDSGESNGVFQLWVNGSLRINRTDLDWVGAYSDYGFNAIELNNYLSSTNTPLQYRQFDNMVLSTEPIGSSDTGPAVPPPNLIFSDDFNGYTNSPGLHGWGQVDTGNVLIDPGAGPDGSNAAKITYKAPQQTTWFRYPVADYDLNQVFVSFDFKFDDPSGGSKFLKLFGKENNPQGTSNTTFQMDYNLPQLGFVFYGRGDALLNDTQDYISYGGQTTDNLVTVEHSTSTIIPEPNTWHNFKAFMRYNSNGNRDGEYIVWVDGVLRLHATNIKNRHDQNSDEFNSVDLANYTHFTLTHPWNLWYDNVQIMRDVPDELKAALADNNAQLSALTLSSGALSPAFSPAQSSYTVDLAPGVKSLDITASAENAQSTITINGQPVTSGQSATVPVGIDNRTITIVVSAPDGETTKTYTITTNRPAIVNECLNPMSGWLFCDDFSTDKSSQYYDLFNRWGRFVRGGKGIDGSQSLVSYYGFYAGDLTEGVSTPPHGTWRKLAVGKTPDNAVYKPAGDADTAERELYWRFYTRGNTVTPGNTNINNGPLARVYGYGPGNVPFMQIDVEYPDSSGVLVSKLRTGTFDGSGAPTGTVLADTLTGTTPIMAADQAGPWRLVEIHAKLNDPGQSNGVYELWIDGELESSKSGLDWVGSYADYGINVVELYNTNNQPGVPGGDNEYRAYDNLVVSREPIGEPGAVSQVNANLSDIGITTGKLSPAYQANTLAYTLTLESGVTSTTIVPELADEEATMKVNGSAHADGSPITLSGSAQVSIEVTARNGTTKKTYVVSLAQAAPFKVNECAAANPDWLFCDDYEQDRMNQYFERTSQSQFYRTTDVGLGGSSGMKAEFRAADGAEHDTGAIKVAFGRTPTAYMDPVAAEGEDLREVYFRFYVKHQEGWIGGGGDKLARLSSMQTASWAQSMIAHVWSGGGSSRDYLIAEPARGTDANGVLKSTKWNDWDNLYWFGGQGSTTPMYDKNHVGEWYAVETRVKLNDPGQSNGIFQVWIDDELQMSRADLNWIGSYDGYGLNWLALENYWNAGTPQDQERYFDNFVISRSKIGLAVEEAVVELSEILAVDSATKLAGEDVELTIGVPDPEASFGVADVIVNYDPEKLEFATVTNGNAVALANEAIESLVPGSSVATAVKENLGQIRVILMKTGTAASGGQPIFKLKGKVKDNAAVGSTAVSLSNFTYSMSGVGTPVDTSNASVTVDIALVNKASLIAAIASAQQKYDAAVVGASPGQYPASAKSALQAAINAAVAVRDDANATQAAVNAAVAALNAAVTTFDASVIVSGEPVNVTALNAAISAAQSKHDQAVEGTKIGQYASGSKSTLQAAINAAIAVRDNAASTQAQVDQAVTTLNQAVAAFSASLLTLVPGATQVTILDLSILAQYYGVTSSDPNWSDLAIADLFGQGEITIEVLAAVAQMILDDWLAE